MRELKRAHALMAIVGWMTRCRYILRPVWETSQVVVQAVAQACLPRTSLVDRIPFVLVTVVGSAVSAVHACARGRS